MKKSFYIRRTEAEFDGNELIAVPEEGVRATLKRHPNWVLLGEAGKLPERSMVESPNLEVKKDGFVECPICSKQLKNQNGLRLHKKVHV